MGKTPTTLCVRNLVRHQARAIQSIVLVAALLAQATSTHAEFILWDGSQSSDWSDPFNWQFDTVPTRYHDDIGLTGEDVAFFRESVITNDLIIDEILTGIDLPFAFQVSQNGENGSFTIDSGGDLVSSLPGEAAQVYLGTDFGGTIGTGTLNVTGTGSYTGKLALGNTIVIGQPGGTGVVNVSGSGTVTTNQSLLSIAGPGSHINISGGGLLIGGVFGVLSEGGYATLSGGALTVVSDDNTDQSGLVNNGDNSGWVRATDFGTGATIQAVFDGTNITTFTVVLSGVPGDFNGDGFVDGSDFLEWQRDPNVGNLADWETNFGTTPAVAATSSVPEPATAIVFLMGLALVSLGGRKQKYSFA